VLIFQCRGSLYFLYMIGARILTISLISINGVTLSFESLQECN